MLNRRSLSQSVGGLSSISSGMSELATRRSSNGLPPSSQFSTSSSSLNTAHYEFSFPSDMFDSAPRKRKKLRTAGTKNPRAREKPPDGHLKFTYRRLRREEFRKRIVDIVIKPEFSEEGDSPFIRDREIGRFYHYIQNGLDTLRAASLAPTTLEKILSLISEKHKSSFANFVDELLGQVKDDYVWTIKRSIVEFALQDPLSEEVPMVMAHDILNYCFVVLLDC